MWPSRCSHATRSAGPRSVRAARTRASADARRRPARSGPSRRRPARRAARRLRRACRGGPLSPVASSGTSSRGANDFAPYEAHDAGRSRSRSTPVRRQLVEEARGQVVRAVAVQRSRRRVRQRQALLRPGHADVAEPPLLLERTAPRASGRAGRSPPPSRS